ncbi:MAG: hypothetical protein D6705_14335 [Deltaproteobacteria bacterium]|nr:MAG: hypothetical protein D6705_14335 [Deltaproteobacteria bacterium]
MARPSTDTRRNIVSVRSRPSIAYVVALVTAAAFSGCAPATSSTGFPRGPGDAWRLDAAPGCAGRRSDGWSARPGGPVPRAAVRCVTLAEAAARTSRLAVTATPSAAPPTKAPRHEPARAFGERPHASAAPPPSEPPPHAPRRVAAPALDADAIVALGPAECRRVLEAAGVEVQTALDAPESVAQPVRVEGAIGGVELRLAWSRDPAHDVHAVFDCRLVVALLPAVALVEAAGYDTLEYVSATRRGGGRRSMHRLGLAADLVAVRKGEGRYNVETLYRRGGVERCRRGSMPRDVFGKMLCRGWRERWFHTILGPDHDRAHHDHLHVDLAPHRKRPSTPYVGLRGASAGDLPRSRRRDPS